MNENNIFLKQLSRAILYVLNVAFYLMILFSCSQSPTNVREGAEEILIDAKNQTALPLDSIFTDIEFIKLETTDESLLGNISQILFTDSFIVITDTEIICVYDLLGKFKHLLGHKGQGPGEYVNANNICVDPFDNTLTVIDRAQDRIIHYNIAGGSHVYTGKRTFMYSYFEYLKSGYKACYKPAVPDPTLGENKEKLLVVSDRNDNIMYGDFIDYYKRGVYDYAIHRPLRKFGDEVYFSPNFSNMIYQITDSMAIPKYYLNITTNGMPPIDNSITNEMMKDYFDRYFIFNGDIVELENHTYINIFTPHGVPFVVYSHSQKKTFFSTEKWEHPLFFFLENKSPKARYKDNAVVFDVPAFHLLMNKEKLYEIYADYESLFDDLFFGLDDDSNPVLVICHLNKNL